MFGFNDRQTVSAIETGVRRVTAEELVLAVESWAPRWNTLPTPSCSSAKDASHGVSPAWTCSNWKPANEGRAAGSPRTVRWRPRSGAKRRSCAARSGLSGARVSRTPFAPGNGSLRLAQGTSSAICARNTTSTTCSSGRPPTSASATCRRRALRTSWNASSASSFSSPVDADRGISGAACRLPELDAVLIARHEVEGRRHFDLAHELFHLLTWDAMPPEHRWRRRERRAGAVSSSLPTILPRQC